MSGTNGGFSWCFEGVTPAEGEDCEMKGGEKERATKDERGREAQEMSASDQCL